METDEHLQLINKRAILNKNLKAIDDKMNRLIDHRKQIYKKVKNLSSRISRLENDKTDQTL